MSTTEVTLALAVFLASAVETVEALTIVLATGATRGWRSALEGSAAGVALLSVLVGVVGVPLVRYVPIATLRVVIGALLLVLGLSWLRKAILRASGHRAPHDEDRIYAETVSRLQDPSGAGQGSASRRDALAFVVSFKAVLLEGMEVVLIVLSLGASAHRLGLAAASAAAAVITIGTAGALVARQLSAIPENVLKMAVGIMLTSFGVFWVAEGMGLHWPGSDLAVPVLVSGFVGVTWLAVARMRALLRPAPREVAACSPAGRVRSDEARAAGRGRLRPFLVGLSHRRHAGALRRHAPRRRGGRPVAPRRARGADGRRGAHRRVPAREHLPGTRLGPSRGRRRARRERGVIPRSVGNLPAGGRRAGPCAVRRRPCRGNGGR